MRIQKNWLRLMAVLMVFGLLVVGCGSKPSTGSAPAASGSGDQKAEADTSPTGVAKQWVAQNIPGLPPEVVDAAAKEQVVSLYSLVLANNDQDVIDVFTKRFPFMKVTVFQASGGPLIQRFTTEAQARQVKADVFMNSSPAQMQGLVDQGLFLNWMPPNEAEVPAPWKLDGYWYGIGIAPIGTVWNTKSVTPDQQKQLEAITTWDQVIIPSLAKKAALTDVRAGGTTQLPFHYFWKSKGPSFLSQLGSLSPVLFNGVNPLIQQMVAGQVAYAPVSLVDTSTGDLLAQGAPLEWKIPSPGLGVPFFLSIPKGAPNMNAAKLFLAWSISQEGLAAWANGTYLAPVSPKVKDGRSLAKQPWYKLPDTWYQADWAQIDKDLPALTSEFGKLVGTPPKQ